MTIRVDEPLALNDCLDARGNCGDRHVMHQLRSDTDFLQLPKLGAVVTYIAPAGDQLTLNKYLYADANPIMGIDPSGHDDLSLAILLDNSGIPVSFGTSSARSDLIGNESAASQPSGLSVSDDGRQFIENYETLRLKPYSDQTGAEIHAWVKGATIGYGHLIPADKWNTYKDGITTEQADSLFKNDLSAKEKAIRDSVKVNLTQSEFDALVSLVYNIGSGAFTNSSVLKLINNPAAQTPYSDLDAAWKAWNKSQGKYSQGLANRRAAELQIYHYGVYSR